MPRQCRPNPLTAEARTERDIRISLDDRVEKNRQLRGAVTIVAIQEHDDVRRICCGQPREACAPISAAWFFNDAGPQTGGNFRRSVTRVAVNYDYLVDQM